MQNKVTMDEEQKKIIIQDINLKVGGDINDLTLAYELENDLVVRRNHLQSCLHLANSEVPTKLSAAIKKAESNSTKIEQLKVKSEQLKEKVEDFMSRTEPLRTELETRFTNINKLEEVLEYLRSFEKIEDLSRQMKQCSDDEQVVLLYGELKELCGLYQKGHRAAYLKEYTQYWHNVLKEKLTKHYEEILRALKWPLTTPTDSAVIPKETLLKFANVTRYLFLIQEPEDLISSTVTEDFAQEVSFCLPVRLLLRPLKKRFLFHFTGPRQTARIDRPEWFLTQTLTWIKDHQGFVRANVQPVADKLQLSNVKAVEEFNAGLIALAGERLHTVLGLYQTQGAKSSIVDVDAALAHAVDETLGFHRELVAVTSKDIPGVLSVLTRAETFVRWLAVEKKYALAKMEEILGSEQWGEAVAAGVGAAVGALLWVPRGADWFVALLKTIEDRYTMLPQPGHRLQFLELQLELIEEWRVRLTQLLHAALGALLADPLLASDAPRHLTAVINAAHHTNTVLLQWAHSLHYLQLHYYRRQFQQFTQQQHQDPEANSSTDEGGQDHDKPPAKPERVKDGTITLEEVELRAKELAMTEITQREALVRELDELYLMSPEHQALVREAAAAGDGASPTAQEEEGGVFGEAPALLARLRDAGLSAVCERLLLDFKAALRQYKTQKWHAMPVVEQMALTMSRPLCRPLAALCGRMARAEERLAPALAERLRSHLAQSVDVYMFEEVALESWFNTGGAMQFTHDVKRNLMPAFAPRTYPAAARTLNSHTHSLLPKLQEACKLLNLDYDDARRLRSVLSKQPSAATESLANHSIHHIQPDEVVQILNQRTDLSETTTPPSVMELF